MIVTLSGVTGIGKSFFKDLLVSELSFQNMVINTTRARRDSEINGIDKNFLSEDEFKKIKQNGKFGFDFEFLGNKYAYNIEDLQSDQNLVTEVHYSTIFNFKKYAKNVFAIYIVSHDIEIAKAELKKRNLPENVEISRLQEIDEHVIEFAQNKELQNQFDYIFTNYYDEESKKQLLNIVKNEIERRGLICVEK